MKNLLSRDDFRNGVFARDDHKCVVCKAPAQDAHHILERRLFSDGGYYLDNGASLCGACHIKAEETTIDAQQLRDLIGIIKIVLPEHFYHDSIYDKWGNQILPDGTRMRGELFYDESVQKILAQGGILASFREFVKYPRTYHLPWSESVTEDDRVLSDLSCFEGKRVVATVKMDGENTNMYYNHIHARSLDSRNHQSRDWVKNLHSQIKHEIPIGWRICGENLYAKHSIHYKELESYFMVFSIWNEKNECLGWDETVEWCDLLGLKTVPLLTRGKFDKEEYKLLSLGLKNIECEGYVIRLYDKFNFKDFKTSIAKFVRKDHVRTHAHWINNQIIPNGLKK